MRYRVQRLSNNTQVIWINLSHSISDLSALYFVAIFAVLVTHSTSDIIYSVGNVGYSCLPKQKENVLNLEALLLYSLSNNDKGGSTHGIVLFFSHYMNMAYFNWGHHYFALVRIKKKYMSFRKLNISELWTFEIPAVWICQTIVNPGLNIYKVSIVTFI